MFVTFWAKTHCKPVKYLYESPMSSVGFKDWHCVSMQEYFLFTSGSPGPEYYTHFYCKVV